MKDLVDWDTAVRLATLATPAGPRVTGASRRAVVALLRRSALDAPAWVGEITGLRRAAERAAASTEVLVVDRAGWIRANADALAWLLAPLPAPARAAPAVPGGREASRRASAVQVGGALGLLSTRVLGQVDPFLPRSDGQPGHRMLLVAPNVLAIERGLALDVLDFPAWVALHETTHAVQLAAAPWLAGHLTAELRALVGSVAAREGEEGLLAGVTRLVTALRRADGADLLAVVLTAEEREHLGRLVAVTTLLEGHAEAVLDAVTPARMPSVRRLRATVARSRRGGAGTGHGAQAVLGRLSGLDAKLAQYDAGSGFVRSVVAQVGHEGLNAVWAGPEYLPTPQEIAHPRGWVARVHGG